MQQSIQQIWKIVQYLYRFTYYLQTHGTHLNSWKVQYANNNIAAYRYNEETS